MTVQNWNNQSPFSLAGNPVDHLDSRIPNHITVSNSNPTYEYHMRGNKHISIMVQNTHGTNNLTATILATFEKNDDPDEISSILWCRIAREQINKGNGHDFEIDVPAEWIRVQLRRVGGSNSSAMIQARLS